MYTSNNMTWSITKKSFAIQIEILTRTQSCKRQVKNYKRDSNALSLLSKKPSYTLPIVNFNLFLPRHQMIPSVILAKGNERIFSIQIKNGMKKKSLLKLVGKG